MRAVLFFVLLAVACLDLLPIQQADLTGSSNWTVAGCFARGSIRPGAQFEKNVSAREIRDLTLWGSWCGSAASTGELFSPVFQAPRILELQIAGRAGLPGLELFLERADNKARFPLPLGLPQTENWRPAEWWLPADEVGQRVRLVAIDHAGGQGGWLGVSTPRGLSLLGLWQRQLQAFLFPLIIFVVQLALFLTPGFVLASFMLASPRAARRELGPICVLAIVVATGAVLGYGVFWTFFLLPKLAGKILSYAIFLLCASVLLPKLRRKAAFRATAQQLAEPLLFTTLAGVCYLCCFFLFTSPYTPGSFFVSNRFFVEVRPGDNVLPYYLADKIYNHLPVHPFIGDWLSSDRPPLQAGIILLERPLALLKNLGLSYELFSSGLQCFWICGVWCLLLALGARREAIRQVLVFLIFSGFLFYNSVYTWPKLLAAAFLLFALAILFAALRAKRPLSYFETGLAAVCLGLAFLSHPGCLFSLWGIALLVVWFRSLFRWRQLALLAGMVAVFYLPWTAYQRLVDPPGNRLLKMHLAGVAPIDARSTWQALRDSYGSHPVSELMRYKWDNLALLAGGRFFDSYGLSGDREAARIAQREWIWNAVGLANVGWLAMAIIFFRKRREEAVPFARWLIALAICNMLFWSLLMFGPSQTMTTHSSYADLLLLSVGLAGFILELPRWVYLFLLAWQIWNLVVVWVWSAPASLSPVILIQAPELVLGVAAMVLLVRLSGGFRHILNPRTTVPSAPFT